MQLKNYIAILRPKQWLKNILIFFPAFFSLSILNEAVFIKLLAISIGFCCVASSIYIFNDLCDIKGDLLHPVKKLKPITSGNISKKIGIILALLLFIIGSLTVTLLYPSGIYFCLVYVIINIVYSLGVKHIPVLDILFVSSGFLIRIFLGGYAINVPISWWLASLIFLMSVYILIAKRKDDVLSFNRDQQVIRKHIYFYKHLNFSAVLYTLSVVIIGIYSWYTFSESTIQLFNSKQLWLTIPFAGIGLFSFTNSVIKTTTHFEPISLILKNKIIVTSLIVWIAVFGWIIYG